MPSNPEMGPRSPELEPTDRSRKVYEGKRPIDLFEVEVTVNGRPLHNYDRLNSIGFEWGYGGAGPYALAISILCDYFGVPKSVQGGAQPNGTVTKWQYYLPAFLEEFVKKFSREKGVGFRLTSQQIEEWIATKPPFKEGRWETL